MFLIVPFRIKQKSDKKQNATLKRGGILGYREELRQSALTGRHWHDSVDTAAAGCSARAEVEAEVGRRACCLKRLLLTLGVQGR